MESTLRNYPVGHQLMMNLVHQAAVFLRIKIISTNQFLGEIPVGKRSEILGLVGKARNNMRMQGWLQVS